MKICLVTTFPPSRGGLSEYGFHIARELRQNPFLSLTILADQLPNPEPELEGYSVQRCWSFNDLGSPRRLLRVIRELDPDVVWFNLLFTTFGRKPAVAFCGLAVPVLSRLTGCYTHVTLHHLMDTVDLGDAGVSHRSLYRVGGALATKMLLMSNSVSVLMPGYRQILQNKYGGQNVHIRHHGILSHRPEYPDFSRRGNPAQRILAFGKWGTYKRLETIIEAFEVLAERHPEAKLVVAGEDHPQTPGYVASLAQRFGGDRRMEFTGYVAEERVADLFRTASVCVMPYSSSTGASGVAHLACAYGLPIVSADLADFRQMAVEEGMAIDFYRPGDTGDLAARLITLLESQERQRAMAEQNFSAALRMTMPRIIHEYVRHFDIEQRTRVVKLMMRLRRLPRWRYLLRFWYRNRLSWGDRSVLGGVSVRGGALRDGDDFGGHDLDRSRVAMDQDGVGARGDSRGGGAHRRLPPPTGSQQNHGAEHDGDRRGSEPAFASGSSEEDKARDTKEEIIGIEGPLSWHRPRPQAGGNGFGSDAKNGGSAARARGNGGGRETASQTGREAGAGEGDGLVERAGLRSHGDSDRS